MRNAVQLFNRSRTPAWSVFGDFDRLIDSMFESQRSLSSEAGDVFRVHADIEESEKAFLLAFDLPGMKKEDIKIDVSDNVLSVSGERKRESETGPEGQRRVERAYGKFIRTFTLPNTVDAEKIEARLENGVLHLAIPKVEAAKPRTIEIRST